MIKKPRVFPVSILALTLLLGGCGFQRQPEISTARATRAARIEQTKAKIRVDRVAHDDEEDAPVSEFARWYPLPVEGPEFDAVHYRVSLDFTGTASSTLATQAYEGEVELTFKPLTPSFQVLGLDSAGLEIKSVRLLNTFESLRFAQRGERLEIDLNHPYQPIDTLTVVIAYGWKGSRGMYYRSRNGSREIDAIYSQSEPELAKYWFPGNARPNDRSTFESIIQVRAPFSALSNGALLSTTEVAGVRTFHWSMRMPMPSYLFVVTAGKYAVQRSSWNGMPVEFWGYPDDMDRLNHSLRNTSDMLTFFSEKLGYRYPFEKYAQIVVPQYMWGGMEHTSATTLTDRTLHGPEQEPHSSSDGLVAHELGHQWFGDLITCRDWSHLWLNEGWATYMDALYTEHKQGRATMLEDLAGGADWYFSDEDRDPRPVVFPYFRSGPEEYFDGHAYAKGSWVIHMLRGLLGDDAFFRGVRQYLHRHQAGLAVSDDFRRSLEEASGRELEGFFDQWLYKPGYPKFEVSWKYDEARAATELIVRQTQDTTRPGGLAGKIPYFRGTIGVEIDGLTVKTELASLETQTLTLPSTRRPRYVKFNTENGWLAKVVMRQDATAWETQLVSSLDVTARVEAIQALTAEQSKLLVDASERDDESWVRVAAIERLGDLYSETRAPVTVTGPLRERLAGAKDWRVRERAATVLGQSGDLGVLPALRSVVRDESSLPVIGAALRAIGRLKAPESFEILVSQLGRDSHADWIRQATLEAMASLADLRTLSLGEEYASPRYTFQTRKGAFALLVALGRAHGETAVDEVLAMLNLALTDADFQVRKDAIRSLGRLGNAKAIPALEKVAAEDPDGRLRQLAVETIARLKTR